MANNWRGDEAGVTCHGGGIMTPRPVSNAALLVAVVGLAAASGLAGCGQRERPPAPAPAPVPAAAAGAAPPAPQRPTWTLILTWLTPDQPPVTSQTVFHDAAACGRARDGALAEGQRLADAAAANFATARAKYESSDRRFVGHTQLGGDVEPTPPSVSKVSAFCAGG